MVAFARQDDSDDKFSYGYDGEGNRIVHFGHGHSVFECGETSVSQYYLNGPFGDAVDQILSDQGAPAQTGPLWQLPDGKESPRDVVERCERERRSKEGRN